MGFWHFRWEQSRHFGIQHDLTRVLATHARHSDEKVGGILWLLRWKINLDAFVDHLLKDLWSWYTRRQGAPIAQSIEVVSTETGSVWINSYAMDAT